MLKLIVVLGGWLLSAILATGLVLGDHDRKFPDQFAGPLPILWGFAGGPISLAVALFLCHPYHWKLKPLSYDERWKHFQRKFPELGRKYFENRQ